MSATRDVVMAAAEKALLGGFTQENVFKVGTALKGAGLTSEEIQNFVNKYKPSNDASVADKSFEDYRNYTAAIFRPGDTLCFVTIEHNLDGDRNEEVVINEFVSYEEAVTKEAFQELTAANNAPSRNPRNTKPSIYVAMNTYPKELIGNRIGRTQENVVDVRTVQADVDYNGEATMSAIKSSTSVPQPSIVV